MGAWIEFNRYYFRNGFGNTVCSLRSAWKSRKQKAGGVTLTCGCSLMGSVEMILMVALTHLDAVSEFLTECGLGSFRKFPLLKDSTPEILYRFYMLPSLQPVWVMPHILWRWNMFRLRKLLWCSSSNLYLRQSAAAVILGEKIPVPMMIGIGFILTGSLISMVGDRKLADSKEQETDKITAEKMKEKFAAEEA